MEALTVTKQKSHVDDRYLFQLFHNQLLHIRISLGSKFQLQQTILIF